MSAFKQGVIRRPIGEWNILCPGHHMTYSWQVDCTLPRTSYDVLLASGKHFVKEIMTYSMQVERTLPPTPQCVLLVSGEHFATDITRRAIGKWRALCHRHHKTCYWQAETTSPRTHRVNSCQGHIVWSPAKDTPREVLLASGKHFAKDTSCEVLPRTHHVKSYWQVESTLPKTHHVKC